ncbi:hypothetical protein HELRODRAFT_117079 [Helobdella robusta]|uniref:SPX domain-containing protein n=1 Tax=Helobdella robusta TaxID=6412 RepID=T1EGK1_HELRO|nr:hypothetical protein HELRODRAFT_117079 [Helobdella robusta]ESO09765.1 hypothetical protein HELRODRAFT_117079 [Helobdella robusta]
MKFSDHLLSHLTPEWHKQYVSYETLKRMLYRAVEDAPSIEITDVFVIEVYYGRFADEFLQQLDKELCKVNNFFLEKLAEAARKFSNLEFDLSIVIKSRRKHQENNVAAKSFSAFDANKEECRVAKSHKTLREIKLAFSEFYLNLVLLQNYQTLNYQGFKKICKKHDKLTKSSRGAQWFQLNVEVAAFYTSKEVNKFIKQVEVGTFVLVYDDVCYFCARSLCSFFVKC